jgi:hypothetical protein
MTRIALPFVMVDVGCIGFSSMGYLMISGVYDVGDEQIGFVGFLK